MFNGGYMSAGDVTHNPTGDIYVSGNFESTLSWGTAPSESLNSTGMRDAFIARFTQAGTTVDAWQFEGTDYVDLNEMQFYNGNLTGVFYFYGTTDFDPGSSVANASPQGFADFAIATFSPSGTLQCLSPIGGAANDYTSSLTFSPAGKLLMTGQVGDSTDFDPGAGTTLSAHNSNFIAQYDMCAMVVGIQKHDNPDVAFCQPNPANNHISLTVKGESELRIYTIEGKLVKEERLSGKTTVDVSDLPNGLYTIMVLQGNNNHYQKIVISR
jgi:hypothetical protein